MKPSVRCVSARHDKNRDTCKERESHSAESHTVSKPVPWLITRHGFGVPRESVESMPELAHYIYLASRAHVDDMTQRFFEDITTNETHELGTWTITEDEIVSFAEQYDPQPFHVDETAAQNSIYGGLIASGWQTVGLTMRTMVDGFLQDVASMGARGVDELRWYTPVRPGDTISVRLDVLDKHPTETDPEIGDLRAKTIGTNQDGRETISWINNFLIRRSEPE